MAIVDNISTLTIETANTLYSFLKVLISSKPTKTIKQYKGDNNTIVVLGNGPSFHKYFENHSDFLVGKDLICVNHFPTSEYYSKLKPRFYITGAPDLWLDNIEKKFVDNS
jgi:hypothetical protein